MSLHRINIVILLLVIVAGSISCHDNSRVEVKSVKVSPSIKKQRHTLAVLPFTGIDTTLAREIIAGIQKKLKVEIIHLPATPLPAFAYYTARQRYIADSLLVFLRATNKQQYEKIIGLTVKDISTRKEPHENWGILGLGSCPGEACVISTFRAGQSKVSGKVFVTRMISLALHELGHVYGLEHCPEFSCLMKDANGKMNLDDGDSYCEKCSDYLRRAGVLQE